MKVGGRAARNVWAVLQLPRLPTPILVMTFKITVAQPVHAPVAEMLGAHGDVDINPGPDPLCARELIERCRDADALMAFMTERIDEVFLDACPRLRIVSGALKGYNNIDVEACSRRGIFVTVVPDLLTEATAERAVGSMIAVARNFGPAERYVRSGAFKGWRARFYGGSLVGATVAVIGAGAVGRSVMRMLGGFGCRRLYVDKKPLTDEMERCLGVERADLADALRHADFVVLCLHLMPETFHMVDADFLARMKAGSYLINPARGSLVDESAVVAALQSGHLAGYAADTFEMEEWARDDRPAGLPEGLLRSDKTMLTPHIGSAVRAVRQEIEMVAAESIVDVAKGRTPRGLVNGGALDVATDGAQCST